MDFCHFLRSEVVVLLQSLYPFLLFENGFPQPAHTFLYLSLDLPALSQPAINSLNLLLYLCPPFLCLLRSLIPNLHQFTGLPLQDLYLCTEVIPIGVVDVECEVVAIFGHFFPYVTQLFIVPRQYLLHSLRLSLEVGLRNQLPKQLIYVCKFIHQHFFETFLNFFGSSLKLTNTLDPHQVQPQLILLACQLFLGRHHVFSQLLPTFLQGSHVVVISFVETHQKLLNFFSFRLQLLDPQDPLLCEVIFRSRRFSYISLGLFSGGSSQSSSLFISCILYFCLHFFLQFFDLFADGFLCIFCPFIKYVFFHTVEFSCNALTELCDLFLFFLHSSGKRSHTFIYCQHNSPLQFLTDLLNDLFLKRNQFLVQLYLICFVLRSDCFKGGICLGIVDLLMGDEATDVVEVTLEFVFDQVEGNQIFLGEAVVVVFFHNKTAFFFIIIQPYEARNSLSQYSHQ